ncbi:hypothetical protein ATKI12_3403 [Kitasatospora sp. Ki12]
MSPQGATATRRAHGQENDVSDKEKNTDSEQVQQPVHDEVLEAPWSTAPQALASGREQGGRGRLVWREIRGAFVGLRSRGFYQ